MLETSSTDPFIYITSKIKHAKKWRDLARKGYPLTCNWIWMELNPKDDKQMSSAWSQMIEDCRKSRVLIIYLEEGERLKGGLVEIGAVLGNGGAIFLVGTMPKLDEGNRDFAQAITPFSDIDSALEAALILGQKL